MLNISAGALFDRLKINQPVMAMIIPIPEKIMVVVYVSFLPFFSFR